MLPEERPKTVLDLFDGHPERWIRRITAKDKHGQVTYGGSPEACSWCLLGAIYEIYPYHEVDNIKQKLYNQLGNDSPIVHFNDSMDTTFDMVVDLVRKAGV